MTVNYSLQPTFVLGTLILPHRKSLVVAEKVKSVYHHFYYAAVFCSEKTYIEITPG